MELVCEEQKREQFKALLFQLSVSQKVLKTPKERSSIYRTLEDIYNNEGEKDEFRHFYSDIFGVLTQVDTDLSLGSIDILAENILEIKKGYRSINTNGQGIIDICKQINKLVDHVNLDIARITYMKRIEQQTENNNVELNDILNKLKDKEVELEDKVEEARSEANGMQKEYITILGIFSSIVLAFIGGIAFSTSVLENIANSSIYRILVVVIGLAFIFINMIYILVRFIMDINNLEKQKIRYLSYMKWINVVLGVLLTLVVIAWFFDIRILAANVREYIYK